MKNAKYYKGDAFEFYKQVCKNKNNGKGKDTVGLLNGEIEVLYEQYNEKFKGNDLASLKPYGYKGINHASLKDLYNYSAKAFVDLRRELTTTDKKRMVKCPNCTISEVDSLDHFVPQEEFSEFAVHPLNLICCCSSCNRRRSSVWRVRGKTTTLNLYLDKLPESQYLYVDLTVDATTIGTHFYTDNRNGIDVDLYELISEHYTRIGLFERFSENADSVATSFIADIKLYSKLSTGPIPLSVIRDHINEEQAALGLNYWQSILKLELLGNHKFLKEYCKLEKGDYLS